MFDTLKRDIRAVLDRDPAAVSAPQVYFLYPGFKAVRRHRRAHWCWTHGLKFFAHWISYRTRKKTGIDIHPGAQIGAGLFIDHGMGVVIGETTVIGEDCTLYQGVTLGGTGKQTGKRHPTLGNNVMVGSGAKILGPFTVGDNCKIAAGAVVLEAIPPDSTAVGVPARVVTREGVRVRNDLDQVHIADPVATQLCRMQIEIERLQKEVAAAASSERKEKS